MLLLARYARSAAIMGKLPEYNRTNNEQSGVSTKIPEVWNGRHVVTSKVIKSDNDPGLFTLFVELCFFK